MFNSFKNNKRIKSGFTLMETMIVVAIIAIVAALSIAIAPNLKRKLNQKELDNKAEIIFQVAQSNLTGLKAGNQEKTYQDTTKYTQLTHQIEDGVSISSLGYFIANNGNHELAEKVVPTNEIDAEIRSNNWIVVYNYSSGTVYCVFYSDEMSFDTSFESSMQYLAQSFDNRANNSTSVGYYGGGNTGYIIKTIKPTVTVTNGEKLYADFTITLPAELSGKTVTYEYNVYQEKSGNHYKGETNSPRFMMDDLTSDATRFKNVFSTDGKTCDLVPGLETKITVRAIINGIETEWSDVDENSTFNSLFDNSTKEASETLQSNRVIVITKGRHLQNLSTTSGCNFTKVGTKKAKQNANIYFSASSEWYEAYGTKKFEPILFESKTNSLTEYQGNTNRISGINIDYVGNISSVDTSSDTYGTGIFSSFYGTVKNWIIQSATVENGQDKPTGIIAGIVDGGEIYQVSLGGVTVNSNNGSVGAIAGKITNTYVHKINSHGITYENSTITNTGNAANSGVGFICGELSGVTGSYINMNEVYFVPSTIRSTSGYAGFVAGISSYVNKINDVHWKDIEDGGTVPENRRIVTIQGGKSTGGLIGYEKDAFTKLEIAYVSGFDITGGEYAGGLIGESLNTKEIVNCHVTGTEVTATKSSGGIAGYLANSDLIESIQVRNSENILSTNEYAGGLIGKSINNKKINSNTIDTVTIESETGSAGGLLGYTEDTNVVSACEIKNSTVKADTKTASTEEHAAGGLIGYIGLDTTDSVAVSCSTINVYKTTISSKNYIGAAGGIIGITRKIVEITGSKVYTNGDDKSYFKNYDKALIEGYITGGIIGDAWVAVDSTEKQPIKITDSEAAAVIGTASTKYCGGLVGQSNNNLTIVRSYASSYMRGNNVAGLVGRADNNSVLNFESCYAAGYITPQGTNSVGAGIAIAGVQTGTASTSSTVNVRSTYTVCKTETTGTYYATVKGINENNILFYAQSTSSESNPIGTPITRSMIDVNVFASKLNTTTQNYFKTDNTAVPYNIDSGSRTTYVYPELRTHYGDWYTFTSGELPGELNFDLVYYENYDNSATVSNNVGVYAGSGAISNTLSETNSIYGDGYGLVLDSSLSSGVVKIRLYTGTDENWSPAKPKTYKSAEKNVNLNNLNTTITTGSVTYKFIDLLELFSIKSTENSYNAFYYGIRVEYGETINYYFFNPRLAKCIVKAADETAFNNKTATAPEAGQKYYIRTPRQLYGLAQTYYYYADATKASSFYQEKNIDYASYQWSAFAGISQPSTQYPIGLGTGTSGGYIKYESFSSNYYGNYNEVKNIVPYASGKLYSMGFFASIGGSNSVIIRDLFIVNEFGKEKTLNVGDSSSNNAKCAGVLAGTVESTATVRNCAVTGFYLSCTNKVWNSGNGCMGGLVGINNGNIHNCETNIRKITLRTSDHVNNYVGAFVGKNNGTISCCCAAGQLDVECYHSAITWRPDISGFAGQSGWEIWNSYCAVHGSYYGAGFSHDDDRNAHKTYFLVAPCYINGDKVQYGPTDNAVWKDGGVEAKIDKLNGANASTTFDIPYSHQETKMGTPVQVMYYNENWNTYLTATVMAKNSNGDLVLTKFGEWPSYEKPDPKQVTLTAASPALTSSAPLMMSTAPSTTTFSSSSPNEAEDEISSEVITQENGENTLTELDGIENNQSENKPAITQSAPMLTMTSLSTELLFVNVTDNETGEDITDKVNLCITPVNNSVSVSTDVSQDYVDVKTGKTVAELTNTETGEYKNSKPILITGQYPGSDSIVITIAGDKTDLYENENNNQENVETVIVDDEVAYTYEPLTVTATVESVRHIGITNNFFEDSKDISDDIILSNEETEKTYTSDDRAESPYRLINSGLIEQNEANILIYSVDGYGFDSNSNGYTIEKIEVIRPSLLSNESFVVYDNNIVSTDDSAEITIGTWDYSEYYCKIGDTVSKSINSSVVTYLPVKLTGKVTDPVTFKITLSHDKEVVVLTYNLDSVENEFSVVHRDGSTIIKQEIVAYGGIVTRPTTEEFEKSNVNSRGYIYPNSDTISDNSNWTPQLPTIVYDDVTFNIVKTPITYSVILNINNNVSEFAPIKVNYDELVEPDVSEYKKDDKVIVGWSLEPDGELKYQKAFENLTDVDGETVVLYAVWGEKQAEEHEGEEKIEETECVEEEVPAPYSWAASE